MKKPRIEDFDPKAVARLGSPMDDLPRIEKAPASSRVKTVESPTLDLAVRPETNRPVENARNLASQNARKPESQKERKEESQIARLPENQNAGGLASVLPYLDLKGSDKTSFRYPRALIERLMDAQYRVKKQSGKKVTFNAVVVAALAWFLWEFEQHGKNSALYQCLVQEGK